MESQPVVGTGASAGIGRATARLLGERGASVGLIARGQAGLDGAAREVEEAGGKALAVSADVDGCHAASMLALAAADPRLRRAGLTDAVAATAYTAAGAAVASTRPPG
jgi:short-subunit dehydrogenase